MTDLEETLRRTLAVEGERSAPKIDGTTMLTRVRASTDRGGRPWIVTVAAAVAVAVVVCVVGWAIRRPGDASVGSGTKEASWAGLSWTMPVGWRVTDAHASGRSYAPDALEDGPFLSTVPTGPICRSTRSAGVVTTTCSRVNGIVRRPADGVIAWLSAGRVSLSGRDNADPGPTTGVCDGSASGRSFHAYRIIGTVPEGLRVALDGCIFGANDAEYERQLRAVIDGMTFTPSP